MGSKPASLSKAAELHLDHLVALEALLDTRNVTRAAAHLGISQSALSARLGRLRKALDDQLFVPSASGRGMVPTPRALELRGSLSDALAHLRAMLRSPDGFDPATSRRTFVIAIPEQPTAVLSLHLVQRLRMEAPHLRLSFLYPPADAVERLETGTIDVLVASQARGSDSLMARALLEDGLLTAQRKGHPRGSGALDLDGFCALDHLLVSTQAGGFSSFVDTALAALGRERRVVLSIQSYGLAPLIVAGSDLICTLPSRLLCRFSDQLDLFEPPFDLPRPRLMAMWHVRSNEDPGHLWFRERLYQAASASRPNGA